MKVNKWTLGLAAVGMVSLPTLSQADEKEKMYPIDSVVSATVLSGYVDTSMHWNLGTGNQRVPGFAYNTSGKQDGFNLDAVKVALEKPLDENQWSAGYKAELLFGPNAAILATTPTIGGDVGNSQLAVKQAYVSLRAPLGNGLDFKVGVFDTVIGYESTDGPNNPNYTRSYGYTIEPTTHTGVLATYQLSDMLGFSAGIANSFGPSVGGTGDAFDKSNPPKAESRKTYMASVAFKAPASLGFMEGSTLYAGFINGFNAGTPASTSTTTGATAANQNSYYIGGTIATPLKGLKLGASFDFVDVRPQGAPGPNGTRYANAAALYASFQATEKLSVHARAEYASHSRTADGASVNSFGGVFPDRVFAYTATLQYDLWKNVLSRLEVRWDHAANGGHPYGNVDDEGGGGKRNAYLVAANLVYKF